MYSNRNGAPNTIDYTRELSLVSNILPRGYDPNNTTLRDSLRSGSGNCFAAMKWGGAVMSFTGMADMWFQARSFNEHGFLVNPEKALIINIFKNGKNAYKYTPTNYGREMDVLSFMSGSRSGSGGIAGLVGVDGHHVTSATRVLDVRYPKFAMDKIEEVAGSLSFIGSKTHH